MANFGPLFVQQTIQVTVVILVALLLDRFLIRQGRSRIRYVMWLLVVAKLVVPPVIPSPTGLFSLAQLSITIPSECSPVVLHDSFNELLAGTSSPKRLVNGLVAIWLAGVAVLVVTWIRRVSVMSRNECNKDAPEYQRCFTLVHQVAADLGMKHVPSVQVTRDDFGPAVFGLLRTQIIFPTHVLQRLTDEKLIPIITHELLHIKRRDTWIGSLQMLAALIWWFHPLAWIAIRRLSGSLEFATDDDVVHLAGMDEHEYADSLLSVIEAGHSRSPAAGAIGVFTCQVTQSRIRRLVDRNTSPPNAMRLYALALLLGLLLLPGKGLVINTDWFGTAPANTTAATSSSAAINADS